MTAWLAAESQPASWTTVSPVVVRARAPNRLSSSSITPANWVTSGRLPW